MVPRISQYTEYPYFPAPEYSVLMVLLPETEVGLIAVVVLYNTYDMCLSVSYIEWEWGGG